ncbi:MAG: EbsC protein [Tetragenococcus koreensis]|nr:EbsC protein [Tetragenococcus koreensis]
MSKNEVELFLEEKNISFESYEFSSEKIDTNETPIFKTLVLKGNKTGPTIALVPLDSRLDYKKAAAVSKNRKIGLPPMDYVLETTGYPHGANTPIGIFLHHPEYPIMFDQEIKNHQKIVVSAGELDKSVTISVNDLIELIHPTIADLLVSKTNENS